MKSWWLYVIALEDSKYYVGITSKTNPMHRIKQHGKFAGAAWTNLHKPIKMIEVQKLGEMSLEDAQQLENTKLREYINKYSIDNVRGGDISTTEPMQKFFGYYRPTLEIDALKTMLLLLSFIVILCILLLLK